LILRRVNKIVATICHILRLKCTEFDFGCDPPQTPLGELTALPKTTYLTLRGPTFKGTERSEVEER